MSGMNINKNLAIKTFNKTFHTGKTTPKYFKDGVQKTNKYATRIYKQLNNNEVPKNRRETINYAKLLRYNFDMANLHQTMEDFKKVRSGQMTSFEFLRDLALGHAGSALGKKMAEMLKEIPVDFKNDGIRTFSMLGEKYGEKIPDKTETVLSNIVGWIGSKLGFEVEKRLTPSDSHNLNVMLNNVSISSDKEASLLR